MQFLNDDTLNDDDNDNNNTNDADADETHSIIMKKIRKLRHWLLYIIEKYLL